MKSQKFKGVVHYTGAAIGGWYIELDASTSAQLGVKANSRVIMTLVEDTLHRALRNSKDGYEYITINLVLVKKYHLKEGAVVEIELIEDTSEFGSDFPEEMEEVMAQDPEGKDLFLRATPGMQRSLLHYVVSAKGVQTRINRALHLMNRVRELHEEGRIK